MSFQTQKVMGVLEDIDFTVDPGIDEEKLAQAAQRREIEENNVHLTVSKTQLKPKKVTILDEEASEYGARVMSIDMASDMAAVDAQRQDIVTEQL
ncbi:hypothetical protein DPMN_114719 [Dreissena polymorpha]|uniref:Uncharacterized protein n=1 Tax=Dreissena polymorpha TaxID=45954 RepID=A0A9D4QT49_DREPO|nr:hypothetical protein DPMN_114719 [Dreissena polymorpha]